MERVSFTSGSLLDKSGKLLDKSEIEARVRQAGFDPLLIQDPPGREYRKHSHVTSKYLGFVAGSMQVTAGGINFDCQAGDVLIIPGNMFHEAVVGNKGCSFYWSEKM